MLFKFPDKYVYDIFLDILIKEMLIMFQDKYIKFKKTIDDFNLVPLETKRIVIAMSGGKDAAAMTHFFMKYQKEERPDIKLEMLLVPVPYKYLHEVPDVVFEQKVTEKQRKLFEKQKSAMDQSYKYWSEYMKCVIVPVNHELIESRILKMHWSCMICFHTKMKAFNDYFIDQGYEDNTVFACGWTKWDSHYTLLSHMLKSDGSSWEKVKAENPQKYKSDCIFLASFAAYPKVNIGIPGKRIYRINPLLEFNDTETLALSKELNTPIVFDICNELFEGVFEQDRRFVAKYLDIFSGNQMLLNTSQSSIMYSYRNLLKFMQDSGLVPPVEEIDNLMYEAYNSNFDQMFELLKK